MTAQVSWRDKAAARRAALAAQIPKDWIVSVPSVEECPIFDMAACLSQLLSPFELEITATQTPDILRHMSTGQWTSEAVVTAFCKRAAVAQQALNCATDFLFDEAIQKAKEYDTLFKETGKTKGPLHGLPVSFKDIFDVKGLITSHGLVSRLDNVATSDSLIVSILREAGAIPFMKTATSQACLLVESTTNIYGTVSNPHNRLLSAGGSSGGEGSVVAFRGSPLGVGTDGGGSLRIPAVWNGVYTIKPTSSRFPGYGKGVGFSDSGTAGYGPFANDLDTVEIYCETVLASKPWLQTPILLPMPWKSVTHSRPLVLGFLFDDGMVHNSPPVDRGLRDAASALSKAGHKVVTLGSEWADMHRQIAGVAFKTYRQEGGVGLRAALDKSGEPLVPRTCTGWSETPLTAMQVWLNHGARRELRQRYFDAYRSLGLDAVVSAPVPHPAPPHGEYITSANSAVYNALDYPTTTIPYGRVDKTKDQASEEWYQQEAYADMPDFPYDRYDKAMKELYTGPEVFENAPLGLQIASLMYEDEHCLAVTKVIDKVLNASE